MIARVVTFSISVLLVIIWISAILKSADSKSNWMTLRMPDIKPDYPDQYLCMARRLTNDQRGELLVGFNPKGNSSIVHHMLIYGCELPGIYQPDSPNFVWDCSSMTNPVNKPRTFELGRICEGQEQIIYGWALDAQSLKLPDKVGFKVGGSESRIQYLVLQVHYHGSHHAHSSHANVGHNHLDYQVKVMDTNHGIDENTDNSGFIIETRKNDEKSGITRQAGVLVLHSGGYVRPGKDRHDIWCEIDEDVELHPFRFRVHTHKLGTRVLGAKLARKDQSLARSGTRYRDEIETIIGQRNPQDPEMFYPVEQDDIVIRRGDTIYAACEFNNNLGRSVFMGNTGEDEMCNFYLMYWTEGSKTLSQKTCFGINPRELNDYLQS